MEIKILSANRTNKRIYKSERKSTCLWCKHVGVVAGFGLCETVYYPSRIYYLLSEVAMQKCIYVMSQNGTSHSVERENWKKKCRSIHCRGYFVEKEHWEIHIKLSCWSTPNVGFVLWFQICLSRNTYKLFTNMCISIRQIWKAHIKSCHQFRRYI